MKRDTLVNLRGTFIRKALNAKVTVSVSRQNSDGFQQILNFEGLEICKYFKSIEDNTLPFIPFIKQYINFLKNSANGNFMELCETIGDVQLINTSLGNTPAVQIYPRGDVDRYYFFDDFDDKIGHIALFYHIYKK